MSRQEAGKCALSHPTPLHVMNGRNRRPQGATTTNSDNMSLAGDAKNNTMPRGHGKMTFNGDKASDSPSGATRFERTRSRQNKDKRNVLFDI